MRRVPIWAILRAAAVAGAATAVGGCHSTTTYNGSDSFYEHHPEYQEKPTYMDPSHAADDPDIHAGRPF